MKQLLTNTEVCEALQIGNKTLLKLIHANRLPFIRVGHRTRFDPDSLLEFLRRVERETVEV